MASAVTPKVWSELCGEYQTCFCAKADAFGARLASAAAFRSEAERLRRLIRGTQYSACAAVDTQRIRVLLPAYGLGGSILEHLRRIVPLWRPALDSSQQPRGASPLPVAVHAYERFNQRPADSDAYLWAHYDDTLPCTSWYGCYWEPLARECPSETAHNITRRHNMTPPRLAATDFEQRWGAVLFAAAVLHAWWRPTAALQQQLDRGVRRIFGRRGLPEEAEGAGACLALHIRRGDSCGTQWRHCPPLEEYLAAARPLATRLGLSTLFVATEDAEVLSQLQASTRREPWSRVLWQQFDRAPLNVTPWLDKHAYSTRFWVEQRLRWADGAERPLGPRPIRDFLVDIEAASRCRALVGTMDSHGSRLMLLRMAARLGATPPFFSLVSPFCPLTAVPRTVRKVACASHKLAREQLPAMFPEREEATCLDDGFGDGVLRPAAKPKAASGGSEWG